MHFPLSLSSSLFKTFAVNVKNGEATFLCGTPGERFREGRIGKDPLISRVLSAACCSLFLMAAVTMNHVHEACVWP